MKLFKKIRKGFTLIELVVVIAVIAILSAVAVVSYISITNKAKQSSDEQAVRQMNTALKASSILGAKDITELFDALAEEGMDAKNYKPLMKDRFFFWDQEDNQIVYAEYKDGKYVGIYPESYKGKQKGDEHHWFSLSKEIKTVDISEIEGSATTGYTVSSGEELYSLALDAKSKATKDNPIAVTKITLDQDVDLMGADISFNNVKVGTFDGGDHTLSNLSQLEHQSFQDSQGEKKTAGLFGEIKESITIQNVKFDNVVIGSIDIGSCGILGGAIRSGAVVTVDDVEVQNSTVYATQKGGILFGYLDKGTAKIKSGVKISNCKVSTLYGESGKLIGACSGATLINEMTTEIGVTLEAYPTDAKIEVSSSTLSSFDTINKGYIDKDNVGTPKNISSGYLVYNKNDSHNTDTVLGTTDENNTEQKYSCFRYFHADALTSITAGSTLVYGTSESSTIKYMANGGKGESNNTSVNVSGYVKPYTYGARPFVLSLVA